MKQLLLAVLVIVSPISAAYAQNNRHLTRPEIAQLKQAIEDEIYDYGYYSQFYQIGENTGTPQHWVARINLFIDPVYNNADRHGEVMYKLMPFGQIYRAFYIEDSGRITLDGDPDNQFPITQPSHQTVFMDEDDVCRLIRTWMRTSLVVDTEPTKEMIESSSQRQKKSKGFSKWEYRQSQQNQHDPKRIDDESHPQQRLPSPHRCDRAGQKHYAGEYVQSCLSVALSDIVPGKQFDPLDEPKVKQQHNLRRRRDCEAIDDQPDSSLILR